MDMLGSFAQLSAQAADSLSDQVFFGEGGILVPSVALGWAGFLDLRFVIDSLGYLLLASLLGAIIGFHPASRRRADRLREANIPQVIVLYAVIGAVIGITVAEFGMVVGIVIFGMGGLLRFRSVTRTTYDMVRMITVTLAGLIAGLGLEPLAVLSTLFAFLLIFFFDTRPACRIRILGMPVERLAACAAIYRDRLNEYHCKIISERQSPTRKRITFVFRLPRRGTRDELDTAFNSIPAELRGFVNWEFA